MLSCPERSDVDMRALHCEWQGKVLSLSFEPVALLWHNALFDPILLWWRDVYDAICPILPTSDPPSAQVDGADKEVLFTLQVQVAALHAKLSQTEAMLPILRLDLTKPLLTILILRSQNNSHSRIEIAAPLAELALLGQSAGQPDSTFILCEPDFVYAETDQQGPGTNCDTCTLSAKVATVRASRGSTASGFTALDTDIIDFIVSHVKFWWPVSSGTWLRFVAHSDQAFVSMHTDTKVPLAVVGTVDGVQLEVLDNNECLKWSVDLKRGHLATSWTCLSGLSACSLSFTGIDFKQPIMLPEKIQIARMVIATAFAAPGLPIVCMSLCYCWTAWQTQGLRGTLAAAMVSICILLMLVACTRQTPMVNPTGSLLEYSKAVCTAAACATVTLAALVLRTCETHSENRFVLLLVIMLPLIWQWFRTKSLNPRYVLY